jgi:hypothetical protein
MQIVKRDKTGSDYNMKSQGKERQEGGPRWR